MRYNGFRPQAPQTDWGQRLPQDLGEDMGELWQSPQMSDPQPPMQYGQDFGKPFAQTGGNQPAMQWSPMGTGGNTPAMQMPQMQMGGNTPPMQGGSSYGRQGGLAGLWGRNQPMRFGAMQSWSR